VNVFALTSAAVIMFVAEAHDGDEAMDPGGKSDQAGELPFEATSQIDY